MAAVPRRQKVTVLNERPPACPRLREEIQVERPREPAQTNREGVVIRRIAAVCHRRATADRPAHRSSNAAECDGLFLSWERRGARREGPSAGNAPVTWPDFGMTAEDLRDELTRIRPLNVADGFRAFYRLYAERSGKSRWGDKTPDYVLHISDIAETLPEAHFIHIIRDRRDVGPVVAPVLVCAGATI